ncbi:MAG: SDR family oxidoreductase, partial [Alphaproteobacteria bacterium]|nr:SDR family oxidoreductase [Alphaproteobacteria bacterium]
MSESDILSFDAQARSLQGKKGVVLGVANRQSIAYGCAAAFRFLGAELALTHLNDRAKPYVEPIAEELEAPIFLPCDVEQEGQLEAVFEAAEKQWGGIDFALHSIAFAPKEDLHGRLLESSSAGFARAMDISCHSFVRMARCAAPLMGN